MKQRESIYKIVATTVALCMILLGLLPVTVLSKGNTVAGIIPTQVKEFEGSDTLAASQINNRQLIIDMIKDAGYGQGDVDTFVRIAKAESNFDESVTNPKTPAAGLFQIMPDTWNDSNCTGDVYSPYSNIQCAIKIQQESGFKPWVTY